MATMKIAMSIDENIEARASAEETITVETRFTCRPGVIPVTIPDIEPEKKARIAEDMEPTAIFHPTAEILSMMISFLPL